MSFIESFNSLYSRVKDIQARIQDFETKFQNPIKSSAYSFNQFYSQAKNLDSKSSLEPVKDENPIKQNHSFFTESSIKDSYMKFLLNESLKSSKPSLNENKKEIKADIEKAISLASKRYKIPKKLIQSIIAQESNFNVNAISKAGAKGLMQLMPETAKELGVKDIFDPYQNILGGTKYLRKLLNMFNDDLKLSLASYNAGPTRVLKLGKVPNFKETQHYVKKVLEKYHSI